jgi:hypothetical protein
MAKGMQLGSQWTKPHPNSTLARLIKTEPGRLREYEAWLEQGTANKKSMDDWYNHGFMPWNEDQGHDQANEEYKRDAGSRNFTVGPDVYRLPPADRRNGPVTVRVDKAFEAPAMGLKGLPAGYWATVASCKTASADTEAFYARMEAEVR